MQWIVPLDLMQVPPPGGQICNSYSGAIWWPNLQSIQVLLNYSIWNIYSSYGLNTLGLLCLWQFFRYVGISDPKAFLSSASFCSITLVGLPDFSPSSWLGIVGLFDCSIFGLLDCWIARIYSHILALVEACSYMDISTIVKDLSGSSNVGIYMGVRVRIPTCDAAQIVAT